MTQYKAIRGMNDILPNETRLWHQVETRLHTLLQQFAYEEIRFPLLERMDLFARSVGEETDIVSKEMYTFSDRSGEQLALRPEGTAGCLRAAIETGFYYQNKARLWYQGPMFRYERPQKGRYRAFHQLGVECLGFSGPEIDVELLALSHAFWKALGLEQCLELQLNTLGSAEERAQHKTALLNFLSQHRDALDHDSQNRLDKNPLRIFDSKVPETQALLNDAPRLIDFLSEDSRRYFDKVQAHLTALNIPFVHNPMLVRGLDYYEHTVFEWVFSHASAQNAVCGGGRYDPLLPLLGAKPTPGIGFAIGMERLIALVAEHTIFESTRPVVVCSLGEAAFMPALQLANHLRMSQLIVQHHFYSTNLKTLLKKAHEAGALHVFILGEQELSQHAIQYKQLDSGESKTLPLNDYNALAAICQPTSQQGVAHG